MNITIDPNSGFCFGVVYAIELAEEELNNSGELYCLGDIVHNNKEVERLTDKGLKIIDHEQLKQLHDCKVLIRAHGEPPETYEIALKNNIQLVDASCPVVLKLQNRVKMVFDDIDQKYGQIVIYGKKGHAEVNGLMGQTNGKGIIVTDVSDLDKIDYSKPISLFSQTTKSIEGFNKIKKLIEGRIQNKNPLKVIELDANDTICRQVSNRDEELRVFAKQYEVVIFVSGVKSSNGKVLYEVCKSVNDCTFFVSDTSELKPEWFYNVDNVGICGATSTPLWLMEKVSETIKFLVVPDGSVKELSHS